MVMNILILCILINLLSGACSMLLTLIFRSIIDFRFGVGVYEDYIDKEYNRLNAENENSPQIIKEIIYEFEKMSRADTFEDELKCMLFFSIPFLNIYILGDTIINLLKAIFKKEFKDICKRI